MPHANIAVFIPHIGCPARCSFCDQRQITGNRSAPTPQEVRESLEAAAKKLKHDPKETEIAFFGGSFTAVPKEYGNALLQIASETVRKYGLMGIRCSTRPDAVDEETAARLKNYGVTSVELGAQSMRDEVLLKNGRGHSAEDVRKAAACIRNAGLSLGLQMMTGLYGDDDEGALYTADALLSLAPKEMRIYPTLVLKGTTLQKLWSEGKYVPQTLDGAVELCAKLIGKIERAGVRLLKVGLHDSAETKNALAGPYHPAFMELCRGKIFLDALLSELRALSCRRAVVAVPERSLSTAKGHGKWNLAALARAGFDVKILPDASLSGVLYQILETDR